ncbi:MAG: hypothetical protein ACPL68_03910 [Candidatus Hydrothermia bacterium]
MFRGGSQRDLFTYADYSVGFSDAQGSEDCRSLLIYLGSGYERSTPISTLTVFRGFK